MNTSGTLHKSTWSNLIAELKDNGLMFLGSRYNTSLEDVRELIDNTELQFKANRTYKTGVSVIKMQTERNTISNLDKVGKVWKHKGYFIIVDNNNIIVYGTKDI